MDNVEYYLAKPKSGKDRPLPPTTMCLEKNAAFYEQVRGGGEYKLTAVLLLKLWHPPAHLAFLLHLLCFCYYGGNFSHLKQDSRENLANPVEPMYGTGHRFSSEGGLGHYKLKMTVRSAEALGCLLASLVVLLLGFRV